MKTSAVAVFLAAAVATLVEAAVPANFPQLMLTAVNAERAKLNLSALCTSVKLQKAAQLHSEDQATNNFMSHTGSNGSTMSTRIDAQKFKWNSIAENVAAGQADVAAVMASWMTSPGHKANILGKYKFFGTGYAYNAKATYKHYWTQDFGTGSTEACDEVPRDADAAAAATPSVTTMAPTPAPTTPKPTPAPTTPKPTPAPTTVAPTPAPTTVAPTPAPTTVAPTPAPTTIAPAPAPTSAPTTVAPTPAPTTVAPTPAPTPAPTTAAPTPAPTEERAAEPTLQQRMLTAVNAERAKVGKAPLCTNTKLQKAAQLHSEDQATNNFMSHTGTGGSTMQSRIEAQKFNWNSLGENVAAGQVDVAAVMASWMTSPGHKANILGDFKFFGMGYALNAKGTYRHYWTQDFAKGSGEACEA